MPFHILLAANLERIHSSMQRELVIVKGESELLPGKGLPNVDLQVPGVDVGDHIGLNWRDPA